MEAVQLPAIGLPEIALMCGAIQQGNVCWQNVTFCCDADIGTVALQPDFCSSPLVYTASQPQANMCCQAVHNLTQTLCCAKAVDTTCATPVHGLEMENLTLQPMLATQKFFFFWTPKARCLP